MITILFFGPFKEMASAGELKIDSAGLEDISSLINQLSQTEPPELIEALNDSSTFVSLNRKYSERGASIQAGDEVGFLPPLSGG